MWRGCVCVSTKQTWRSNHYRGPEQSGPLGVVRECKSYVLRSRAGRATVRAATCFLFVPAADRVTMLCRHSAIETMRAVDHVPLRRRVSKLFK